MKKLKEIPNKNDKNNKNARIKTLLTAIPEMGVANNKPPVNGNMVTKI